MSLIAPHGGQLVDRVVPESKRAALQSEAQSLPSITLSAREACDLEMIAIGAFSPLTGFMGRADFERCCREMRLASGTVWPIPVTLCPANDVAEKISVGQKLALKDGSGTILGVMTVSE